MIEHLPGILITVVSVALTAAALLWRKIQWERRWFDGVCIHRGHHIRSDEPNAPVSEAIMAIEAVRAQEGTMFGYGLQGRIMPVFWIDIVDIRGLDRSPEGQPRTRGRMVVEREFPWLQRHIVLQVEKENTANILIHEIAHAWMLENYGDPDPMHTSKTREWLEGEILARYISMKEKQ